MEGTTGKNVKKCIQNFSVKKCQKNGVKIPRVRPLA